MIPSTISRCRSWSMAVSGEPGPDLIALDDAVLALAGKAGLIRRSLGQRAEP
jgi:hypothetical protein